MSNYVKNKDAPVSEKTSVEKELAERVLWFIDLRWFAILGVLIGCGIAWSIQIQLPFFPLLYTAGAILIYNLICFLFLRWLFPYNFFANTQICIDWLALTTLVHYSGGLESPLIFYFIFHVIIAAILLSRRACFLQVTLVFFLILGLTILEFFGVVPHVKIKELMPLALYNNTKYVLSALFFFASALYVSAYLATSVTAKLRKREEALVQLRDSIAKAHKKLETLDKAKTDFTYKVTHELRSPLSAIQSLLKSVEEGYADHVSEKAKEVIVRAERRTGFLLDLVNDLLDLVAGRVEKPKEGDLKLVDISVIIKNVITLMQSKIKGKGVLLQMDLSQSPSGGLTLHAVPDDIEIIITNLVDNSIKYTPPGGQIRISTKRIDNAIKLDVSDTGIGIPEKSKSRIFDEFYRAENAKQVITEGTGLGLTIVKQLVHRYKGEISFVSELSKGTTFTIVLPFTTPQSPPLQGGEGEVVDMGKSLYE
ncbi:MAG TPA: sensor histidine kinase [Candidatus Brocadiia bacterium]|nr:HAMP domain-containing sensor histidine kinase [Candidatus Brocadiales bacterium]